MILVMVMAWLCDGSGDSSGDGGGGDDGGDSVVV